MKEDLFGKCPYLTVQKLLSGKWSIYILLMLSDSPLRFNELQRRMPEEMTHTSLSRQLKMLEQSDLVERIDYRQIPPKVEYKLSDIGRQFTPVLDAMGEWGKKYIEHKKICKE